MLKASLKAGALIISAVFLFSGNVWANDADLHGKDKGKHEEGSGMKGADHKDKKGKKGDMKGASHDKGKKEGSDGAKDDHGKAPKSH